VRPSAPSAKRCARSRRKFRPLPRLKASRCQHNARKHPSATTPHRSVATSDLAGTRGEKHTRAHAVFTAARHASNSPFSLASTSHTCKQQPPAIFIGPHRSIVAPLRRRRVVRVTPPRVRIGAPPLHRDCLVRRRRYRLPKDDLGVVGARWSVSRLTWLRRVVAAQMAVWCCQWCQPALCAHVREGPCARGPRRSQAP